MNRHNYTVIVVPGSRSNLRKYQVSSRFLSFALITLAVIAAASAGTILHLVKQTKTLERLTKENGQLKLSLAKSHVLTNRLTRKISALTGLSVRLKELAGIRPALAIRRQPARLGMGGVTMDGNSFAADPKKLVDLQRRAESLEKSFNSLNTFFQDKNKVLATIPSLLPAEGWLSSNFGIRRNPFTDEPDFHQGLDISNEIGTPVIAPADGTVTFVGLKGSYGDVIEIRHDSNMSTLFGHLEKTLVHAGQKVTRGQRIGLMGNTGNSTGSHLHYEVHVHDQAVNPVRYVLNQR